MITRQPIFYFAPDAAGTGGGDTLALQRENQSLRMELSALHARLEQMQQDLEQARYRQDKLVEEKTAARLEALFNDAAGPASQILTQADLLEKQDRPLQARDVLPVARRIVRALERHGLAFEGQIGERAAYDPDRHTPLSGGSEPQPGQPVAIRFAGAAFRGKTLYKAVVELCQDD